MASIASNGAAQSPGRRSNARLRLGIPGRLILTSGNRECLLNDISASGGRVTVAELPRSGGSAFLRFLEFEIFCEVKWVRGNQCGLRFADRLSREDLVRLRVFADNFVEHDRAVQARQTHDWVLGRTRIL